MASSSLTSKVVNGTILTLLERVMVLGSQFIIEIILARLLMPEDFGLIGILTVFINIALSLIDGGFNQALIQKIDRTDVDYSTVFYANVFVAVTIYAIFYVSAPFIASFYNLPQLQILTRVMSLSVVINALGLVQTAKFMIEFRFKILALTSVVSIVVSGLVGVIMAYTGYGVWALVAQPLSCVIIRTVILWMASNWKPLLVFSKDSFRTLFRFGSKLLMGVLVHTLFRNVYTLIIGKLFKPSQVGYFSRADIYSNLMGGIAGYVINKVFFPFLSNKQNDDKLLVETARSMFRIPMYVYLPSILLLVALSKPLIVIVLGEKWLPCAGMLQILLIGFILDPMTTLNMNLLYVKGRSDLSLKVDVIKKSVGILVLFISIPFGLLWICACKSIYNLIAFILDCHYTKKTLDYGLRAQLKDIFPIIINSVVMFFLVSLIVLSVESYLLQLCFGVVVGLFSYVGISLLYREPALLKLWAIIRRH